MDCIANPEIHSEFNADTTGSKKVAIIGGGPAGIFAALYLKKKGYNIALLERNNYLGGQWVLARRAPKKNSLKEISEDLIKKLKSKPR
ncbi:MAG: FAD-dependent oxidoreductase [Fervidobacterium sp.]